MKSQKGKEIAETDAYYGLKPNFVLTADLRPVGADDPKRRLRLVLRGGAIQGKYLKSHLLREEGAI